MKETKIFLLIVLLLSCFLPMALSASLSVTPSLLELQIPPGKSYTDAILATNVGKAKVYISVYLSDFQLNSEGNIAFFDPGTNTYSLAPYLRVNPTSFSLESGEEKWVRFTVTTPEQLTGERQSIIFFHTQSSAIRSVKGRNVLVSARIGVTVYAATKTTIVATSEVADFFFKQDPQDSSFHYAIVYHNTGNIHLRPSGKLKILDQEGKSIAETILNEKNSSVLGKSYRIFAGQFKNKSPFSDGIHIAQADLDYGKKIIEAEKPVHLLNQGGVEAFDVTYLRPKVDSNTSTVVFKAKITSIEKNTESERQEKRFRLKASDGRLLADIPADVVEVNGGKPGLEVTGQWSGDLQPGMYFAEFLIFLHPGKPLASFHRLTVQD